MGKKRYLKNRFEVNGESKSAHSGVTASLPEVLEKPGETEIC